MIHVLDPIKEFGCMKFKIPVLRSKFKIAFNNITRTDDYLHLFYFL